MNWSRRVPATTKVRWLSATTAPTLALLERGVSVDRRERSPGGAVELAMATRAERGDHQSPLRQRSRRTETPCVEVSGVAAAPLAESLGAEVARKSEHSFGDDVALDHRGSPADGEGLGVEESPVPRAALFAVEPEGPRLASIPRRLGETVGEAMTSWPWSSASAFRSEASDRSARRPGLRRQSHPQEPRDLAVRPAPYEVVALARVVRDRRRAHQSTKSVAVAAAPEDAFARERHAFVAEGHLREAPPVVHVAEQVLVAERTSSRNTSLKAWSPVMSSMGGWSRPVRSSGR